MIMKTFSVNSLQNIDAYWRAANYLSVGEMYLHNNPLLKRPLEFNDVKPALLGHWGTTPGQNFIYVHLNRIIKSFDLDMIYVSGPGHGGPAVVSNTYLEGTYSEIYPNISQDEDGLRKLFRQLSFPGGIPSHASPECPGSIHEGGELGYSLSHSFGAAVDNPNLIVACVVGDGEAETGPLATAWHSNKFLNPITDAAVLPILHLNGYKIANPSLLARISREELEQLFRGYGWTPYFVEGHEPDLMHEQMASTLDTVIKMIERIQQDARVLGNLQRPHWPMIVLESPKGWTGPKIIDGQQIEGTFPAHQVPVSISRRTDRDRRLRCLALGHFSSTESKVRLPLESLRGLTTRSKLLREKRIDIGATKPLDWPCIITLVDSRSRNSPIDSADEAFFQSISDHLHKAGYFVTAEIRFDLNSKEYPSMLKS